MLNNTASSPELASRILMSSVAAARRELITIQELCKREDLPGKLRDSIRNVHETFLDEIRNASTKLDEIEQAGREAGRDGQLLRAWRQYMVLRTETIPGLTNDLLALIGGAYLQEHKLDAVMKDNALTASELATSLLAELNMVIGQSKILIVGEERSGARSDNILRLRFPACDIWNLPFIVHEYGYWYGRHHLDNDSSSLCARIRLIADVRQEMGKKDRDAEMGQKDRDAEMGQKDPDAGEPQYLPELVEVWKQFRYCLEAERGALLDGLSSPIDLLVSSQLEQIFQLYADVFATYHLGPVYAIALLYLRFVPDASLERHTPSMPSFEQRFVFVLETLRRMNDDADLVDPSRTQPFNSVIKQIEERWEALLASLSRKNNYKKTAKRFGDWLLEIWLAVRKGHGAERARAYQAWRDELALAKVIDTIDTSGNAPGLTKVIDINGKEVDLCQLSSKASPRLEVLNAAWQRRLETNDPEKLKTIEQNALRILANPEAFIIGRPKSRPEGSRPTDTRVEADERQLLPQRQPDELTTPTMPRLAHPRADAPWSQPRPEPNLDRLGAAPSGMNPDSQRGIAVSTQPRSTVFSGTHIEGVAQAPPPSYTQDEVAAINMVLSALPSWSSSRIRFDEMAKQGIFHPELSLSEQLTQMNDTNPDPLQAFQWLCSIRGGK